MKNRKPVLDRLEYIIEQANVYNTPGSAAVKAVKDIDERFIVIGRNHLPIVNKAEDISVFGGTLQRVGGVTDQNKDPEFHRKRALEHLAMATHLLEEQKKAEEKLHDDRKKVWEELFPGSPSESFDYKNQVAHVRIAIDKIISLKSSLKSAHF